MEYECLSQKEYKIMYIKLYFLPVPEVIKYFAESITGMVDNIPYCYFIVRKIYVKIIIGK